MYIQERVVERGPHDILSLLPHYLIAEVFVFFVFLFFLTFYDFLLGLIFWIYRNLIDKVDVKYGVGLSLCQG